MFKFIALALVFTTCSCQLLPSQLSGLDLNSLGGQIITRGNTRYLLVPLSEQQRLAAQTSVTTAPVLTRQTFSLPAPRPVVLQAPAPVAIQRPAVVRTAIAEENYGPAEPYSFGFQSTDEQGNSLSRQESSDGNGAVTGSYSYTDAQGLSRLVEYIADAAGYRATVKTNEPGTANANPADVQIEASEVPANVQQIVAQYSQPRTAARVN